MLQTLLRVLLFHTVHDFNKKAGQGSVDSLQMILDPYIESLVYAGVYILSRATSYA